MTMTNRPCPRCDGRGYTTENREHSSETFKLRCDDCLETGKVITAAKVMVCSLHESHDYPGHVYYYGFEWLLVRKDKPVCFSRECNFPTMLSRDISHGYTYSLRELRLVDEIQDAIDTIVTQELGEPVTQTLPQRLAEVLRHSGWPVETRA